MEDSFESVDKSVDLDDPSEHSADLDDPGEHSVDLDNSGEHCKVESEDDLPSDSSLGQLLENRQGANDLEIRGDIHVGKSKNLQLNEGEVSEVSLHGKELLPKEEVDEQEQLFEDGNHIGQKGGEGLDDNDEVAEVDEQVVSEQVGNLGEGRRCSARLRGKNRRRWTNEMRMRQGYGLPSEPPDSQQVVDNRLWSLEEKRQLLQGLRKHGSKKMVKVAEEVPSKSLEQVMKKVVRDKRAASYVTETHWMGIDGARTVIDSGEKISRGRPKLETLDLPDCTPQGELVEVERLRPRTLPSERWLEAVETSAGLTSKQGVGENQEEGLDCSEALPNVLTWIADLEEHPDPADCGGVDYAAIYRYLAALCQVGFNVTSKFRKKVEINYRAKHLQSWTKLPVPGPLEFCPH